MTTDPHKPFRDLIEAAKQYKRKSHINAFSVEAEDASDALTAALEAAEAALPALAGGESRGIPFWCYAAAKEFIGNAEPRPPYRMKPNEEYEAELTQAAQMIYDYSKSP